MNWIFTGEFVEIQCNFSLQVKKNISIALSWILLDPTSLACVSDSPMLHIRNHALAHSSHLLLVVIPRPIPPPYHPSRFAELSSSHVTIYSDKIFFSSEANQS